jgi:putative heme iron utilization protein
MNKDHVDSMVAIVCQRVGSLPRPPRTARMTSIDANGFTLEYRIVKSLFFNPNGERRTVRVPFTPAVKEASEVRQRIVDLAQDAQQKRPKRVRKKQTKEDQNIG